MVKIAFPVAIDKGKACYEIPYGTLQRSLSDLDNPAQNWVDLSNDSMGVSLLNDGRYGFSINEGMIKMSLIRGPRDMDPRMDHGINEVEYALFSHKEDWRNGETANKGTEFNRPLVAMQESQHLGEVNGWTPNIALPLQNSFYSTNQKNVQISAVKLLQGDWSPESVVVRLFETSGTDCPVTVKLPFKPAKITEANHIEIPLDHQPEITVGKSDFTFRIGKDQIRTFIVNGFDGNH